MHLKHQHRLRRLATCSILTFAMALLLASANSAYAQAAAETSTAKTPAAETSAVPAKVTWPPAIPKADANGVIAITSPDFLKVPEDVQRAKVELGAAFDIAKAPPTVLLTYHDGLPHQGVRPGNSTGWTSWGDILVASDGSVYSAIGDHGADGTRLKEGQPSDAAVIVYRWLPEQKKLVKAVEPNKVVKAGGDDPNWSKIHAGIHEGADGMIYFVPTFNDGQRAPDARWTDKIPTGQVFQFNPKTGEAKVVGLLPANSATATSELDAERNILYINLEGAHRNALWAFDLSSMKPVFQGPDAMIAQNRNMAIARDGSIYYNMAEGRLGRYDPQTKTLSETSMVIPGGASLRSSTAQAKDGWIYATTYGGGKGHSGALIRFNPEENKVETLTTDFLNIGRRSEASLGNYTTVTVLSPDEKFVYYLPGAHGGAVRIGCPVVQYNVETGKHKVIAFLRDTLERETGYVPGGTYGASISADGSTLFVNFNGHATEANMHPGMKPIGFGLTAFAAIEIPASER